MPNLVLTGPHGFHFVMQAFSSRRLFSLLPRLSAAPRNHRLSSPVKRTESMHRQGVRHSESARAERRFCSTRAPLVLVY